MFALHSGQSILVFSKLISDIAGTIMTLGGGELRVRGSPP
jgi:hypothetical protein